MDERQLPDWCRAPWYWPLVRAFHFALSVLTFQPPFDIGPQPPREGSARWTSAGNGGPGKPPGDEADRRQKEA